MQSVPISNTDSDYLDIEKFLKSQLPEELTKSLELIGSFGKKPKGSVHTDIDYLYTIPYSGIYNGDVGKLLSDYYIDYEIDEEKLCYTIVLRDHGGTPRSIDIFVSECVEFSYKAFYVPMWYQTKYPFNILPEFISQICKIHFRIKLGEIDYSPSYGVKLNGQTIIDDWDELRKELNLGTLDRVEDIAENVRHKWSDFQREQLTRALAQSKRIEQCLESEDMRTRDLLRKIDNDI